MSKILFIVISCEWIFGSWVSTNYYKPPNSLDSVSVERRIFNRDGTLISITPWDSIGGKWFMNSACDSIAIVTKNFNLPKLEYQYKISYINDTLKMYWSDEKTIILYFKKDYDK